MTWASLSPRPQKDARCPLPSRPDRAGCTRDPRRRRTPARTRGPESRRGCGRPVARTTDLRLISRSASPRAARGARPRSGSRGTGERRRRCAAGRCARWSRRAGCVERDASEVLRSGPHVHRRDLLTAALLVAVSGLAAGANHGPPDLQWVAPPRLASCAAGSRRERCARSPAHLRVSSPPRR